MNIFNIHHTLFIDDLKKNVFKLVDFDLVVYDEIEHFTNTKDPLFNYPF